MKRICFTLLVGLAVFLMGVSIHADGYRYLFFEDFGDTVPPAFPTDWLQEDANTDGTIWHSREYGGFQGGDCARYLSTGIQANDWIFTPSIDLESGVEYTLSFKTRVSSGMTHKLNACYGTTQDSGMLPNSIVHLTSITNLDAQETSATFTPSSTDAYYIGFHCHSDANQLAVFLDDVGVSVPEDDLTVQIKLDKISYSGSNSYSTTEEKKAMIILRNTGSSSIVANTLFTIGDSNDPHTVLSFIVKDPGGSLVSYYAKNKVAAPKAENFETLAPGDCACKYFDLNNGGFDFSAPGIYTIQVEYENLYKSEAGNEWRGKIVSDPVTIQIQ